ncbi:MAG: hypothetical protein BZY80_00960 [SAR202 cluster bacterium Io17-Chloro-G2]|nr:MAG: hypothetical protein BZY80_00960 [SAR202 cluster bacterium Io17-Chloro-G2]
MKKLSSWFSSLFSSKIEDSVRLRSMALGALVMASMGLAWVGGSWWYTAAGCALGVTGHWTSWRWRYHQSRVRPLLIAASVIAISVWMRSETVAALNGDWVPVGHFLILVLGISSFDLRTRGGLYTSLALGGTVLFFASQQAFGAGFGIFFIGFLVALLGFLALSFLEDSIRDAQVFWRNGSLSVSFFWVGLICALFMLSSLAFWLMPKDATNFAGPPHVSILPYSTSTLNASGVPGVDLGELLSEAAPGGERPSPLGQAFPQVPDSIDPPSEAAGSGQDASPQAAVDSSNLDSKKPSPDNEQASPDSSFSGSNPGLGATLPNGQAAAPEDVALFVRSKVSSYWRGQTRYRFERGRWLPSGGNRQLVPVEGLIGQWFNRESANLDNSIRYHQAFFVRLDHPQSIFMGYRGLKVMDGGSRIAGTGVRDGDSYQVVSAQPRDDTQRLNQDYTAFIGAEYMQLSLELDADLRKIAGRLGQGAVSDFQRLEQIVGYVAANTQYDPGKPLRPYSEVHLRRFLLEQEPGGDLEFATAVTLLARASGLPARLALGYLPGVRDPLSGAYLVRVKDAHAWSEVYFANHGWVPFDSTPRAAIAAAENPRPGFNRLFQAGVNTRVPDAVDNLPTEIPDGLLNGLRNPLTSVLFTAFALAILMLRLLYPRWKEGRVLEFTPALAYARPGSSRRREMLHLYSKAEQQLKKHHGSKRLPWQTAMEYTGMAAGDGSPLQNHLRWFVKAVWWAAYSPTEPTATLVEEGRERLLGLRKALKDNPPPGDT